MLVTFFGYDPNKTETGDAPWISTISYLGGNLVQETP